MIRRALVTVVLLLPTICNAGGWDMFGEHEKLDGLVIIEVGDVSKLSPPFGITWDTDIYLLGSHCLSFSGYSEPYGLYSDKAGLLLAEPGTKKLSVAILKSSILDIETKLYPVTLYECPASVGLLDTLEAVER